MSQQPAKTCVICGDDDSAGSLLLQAPCQSHWICADDLPSFFVQATASESLFPPKCCDQVFLLQDYEDYIPFETAWAYQVKEQGEYATLAKFRVYCASPRCAKFLHPTSHIEDAATKISYAICESEDCNKMTCVSCRMLLDHGTEDHICLPNDDEAKFKLTVIEKGYQECSVCGATVELAEACNHITCGCGNSFCYICGKEWLGMHGCPHYGSVVFDEEGYNQDGFHRDTGLDREGLTRRQERARARGEEDSEEEGEEDEFDGEDEPDWDVMQHLTPEQRVMINMLPQGVREDALDQLRIDLFETQGIIFDHGHPRPDAVHNPAEEEGRDVEGADENGDDAEPDDEDEVDAMEDEPTDAAEGGILGNRAADNQPEDKYNNTAATQPNSTVTVLPIPPFILGLNSTFQPATAVAQSSLADFDSNASYVGSDVHARLANDFNDEDTGFDNGKTIHPDALEALGIDPIVYGRGHPSIEGESGFVGLARPTLITEVDIGESSQQVRNGEQHGSQSKAPGAWLEDEML